MTPLTPAPPWALGLEPRVSAQPKAEGAGAPQDPNPTREAVIEKRSLGSFKTGSSALNLSASIAGLLGAWDLGRKTRYRQNHEWVGQCTCCCWQRKGLSVSQSSHEMGHLAWRLNRDNKNHNYNSSHCTLSTLKHLNPISQMRKLGIPEVIAQSHLAGQQQKGLIQKLLLEGKSFRQAGMVAGTVLQVGTMPEVALRGARPGCPLPSRYLESGVSPGAAGWPVAGAGAVCCLRRPGREARCPAACSCWTGGSLERGGSAA